MMEKRNVIDGTVKTAEADNEEDAIGKAASAIKDKTDSKKPEDEPKAE